MLVNVAQQLKEGVGSVRHYEISETTADGFPLAGEVKLVCTDRSIWATGQLRTVAECVCSRCLEEFEESISLVVEEEYFAVTLGGVPSPMGLGTENFVIGQDNILDLSEAVHQSILLGLPIKPVCRPECVGLCPSCGRNLNFGPCDCVEEPSDSRWSPLRNLPPDRMPGGKRRV